MKLKAKNMKISSGGHLVVVLNRKDAEKLDIHTHDRIKVKNGKKMETVSVNIGQGLHVSPGQIGVLSEVQESLGSKNGDQLALSLARKPLSLAYIRKKMEGCKLSKKEIDQIVWDITHNKLSDTEMTYFVAACYTKSMDMEETVHLTKSIASHGEILKLNKKVVLDKHCIGGIPGNRTTMVLVPLLAAAGYAVPKTSSRSITSPAGTADTMEVLCPVSHSLKKMKSMVEKTNGCIMWGGAMNLAPADDKIIRVEKPLEIDAESQLLASIMAKKFSVSSTHILIDIPIGEGAKVRGRAEANHLKYQFEKIGKMLKRKVKVIITDGSQPIGNGIGPALEARDVLWVLEQHPNRPKDLEKKCLDMAAHLFDMAGVKNGRAKAKELLVSGKAHKKMVEIVKAQGGEHPDPSKIKLAKNTFDVKAHKSGTIKHIDDMEISSLARIAGAPTSKGSGLFLHTHAGEKVKKGQKLFTIYAEGKDKMKYAKDYFSKCKNCYVIR